MDKIYIASPYSHENSAIRERRYERVRKFITNFYVESPKSSLILYSPIVYWHHIAQDGGDKFPDNYNFWLSREVQTMKECVSLWIYGLEGWKDSKGIHREIGIARALGLPIKLVHPEAPKIPLVLEF
jgi:hypothetical protein